MFSSLLHFTDRPSRIQRQLTENIPKIFFILPSYGF